MCGIVGVIAADTDHRAFRGALDELRHRGPDADGVWIDNTVGIALGHTRLSVIDLSPAGAQPKMSADGRLVLVYNGELYNLAEIRKRLESAGHGLRGRSDTEVLLEAFSAWGVDDTLAQADGMFAFGLWDRATHRLTLGRDRMGEKPLYYGRVGGGFAFASELAALRALPGFDNDIDRDALTLYFRHKYVPHPHSIHRGIAKLPPATTLTLGPGDEIPQPVPYWRLTDHLPTSGMAHQDPAEVVDRFTALLDRSVAERMVADVPVGAFLSGGIDSSVVTAAMVRTGTKVKTYTIGFADSGFDESHHAAEVAAHLGTDHTRLEVTPEMALAVVPDLPQIYSEPFADSSQIPSHLIARLAREHVTVAITGDGGDELFGGYNRHLWVPRILRRTHRIPRPLRHAASSTLLRVPAGAWNGLGRPLPERIRPRQISLKVAKTAHILAHDSDQQMLHRLTSHWHDPESLVIGGIEPTTLLTDPAAWPALDESALRLMTVDALTYLPDDILTKLDRAAMAVGLETRAPLLATPIVEMAAGLPLDLRIRDGETKWLLRAVLDRSVPRAMMDRPKAGFGIPLDAWLRGPLRTWADDLLDPAVLRNDGYLRPEPVMAMWADHRTGRCNAGYQLWDVLMFQNWLHHRQNVPDATPPPRAGRDQEPRPGRR